MIHTSKQGDLKVYFDLRHKDQDGWPPVDAEVLWGRSIGPTLCEVRSVPFYIRGLAFADVIETVPRSIVDSTYDFVRVASRSGHSTYRLFRYTRMQPAFDEWLGKLTELMCTYEQADAQLYAIDMGAEVDVVSAYRVLEDGAAHHIWDFEEGYYLQPSQ